MPDHIHLLVKAVSAEALSKIMTAELCALTRSLLPPGSRLWQPAAPPKLIPNLKHLLRNVRYVHLNPCRDGLASDPLEWEWSTHRDATGTAFPGWLDRSTLELAMGGSPRSFSKRIHDYISADPSVRVGGTVLPERLPASDLVASLSSVEWAVLQATRASGASRLSATPARRLMLLACERIGRVSRARLSEWLEIQPRAIQEVLSVPVSAREVAALEAVFALLSARQRFEGARRSG
jgi:hypothetical protein